ncbi:hypothetical protein Dsin_010554 [Dipteronia sinensis]|uniref:Uncharacterized protein n=1 Tax=Dipteronia sinensis TaxID=43782 RepID=A0AAE0AU18_9ROSI|nr:hypothetical protein Dsin_010554 [Dipteronia sinensis]
MVLANGKAFAFELARKGLNLVLVGRNPDKLKDVSDSIRAKYFHEVDEKLMMNLIKINVEGTTKVTHAVLPGMLKRKKGAIVNIGSAAANIFHSPLYSVYAATKSYVDRFSRCLYDEYKKSGIDVQSQVSISLRLLRSLSIGYKKQPRQQALRFFSSAVDAAATALAHCEYIFACRVSSMEKPSSASDSGGSAPYNTVFVNTSLDTHLAFIVSGSDTVADVKEKILHEHLLCFPNFGEINIQALKVKRRGNLYRLPDSIFVKSAFDGIRKGWFLSVDASRPQKLVENQDSREEPKSGDIVACFGITDNFGLLSDGPTRRLSDDGDSTLPQVQRDWHAKEKLSADTNCDNNYNILSLDTNNRSDPELQEKHELLDSSKCKDPIMRTGCDEDNFRNVISDDHFSVSLDGGGTSSAAGKKKQKPKAKRKRGNESLELALKNVISDDQFSVSLDGGGTSSAAGKKKQKPKAKRKRGNESLELALKNVISDDQFSVSLDGGGTSSAAGKKKQKPKAKRKRGNESLELALKNVISDDQFSVSLDGGGTSSAAGKKKQKPKANRKRGNESLELALKENDASAQGPDKDISQQVSEDGVLIHDKVMGSKAIADKPCHISSDTSKSPAGEVQMTNVLSNGTAVPRNYAECEKENSMNAVLNVQCPVSMEEASPGPTKKKRKTLNSKNSSEVKLPAPVQEVRENEDVDMSANDAGNDESTIDPPEAAAASAIKEMRISDDHHPTEAKGNPPVAVQEGNDLKDSGVTVEPGKSSKKKKKSKKTQDPVIVTQVTSGKEVPPVAVQEGNDLSKDIGIEHGSVMVNDSQKFGSDQMARVEEERVTTDDESTNDSPEAAAASAVKEMRISDDLHTTEAEGNPPVAVQEGNDLKDSGVTVEPGKSSKKKKKCKKTQDPVTATQVTSGTEVPPVAVQEGNDLSKDIGIEHGSVMVNDSQKFGSDQTARVEEERPTTDTGNDESTNDPPEAAAASAVIEMRISDDRHITEVEGNPPVVVQEGNEDSGVSVEPGKSSKKKRKSKKTQDPVTATQVTSGTEVPPVAVQEGNDLSKDIGIEHGSVMVNDSQKFGSDQTARVEEERPTTDTGNDESTNDPPEAAAASAVKEMRISDDSHITEVEGNPPVVVQEGNEDSGVSVEPGKSSKKKKKSKKTQDPVTQVTSGTEVPPVAVQEGNDLSKDIGIEHGSVMVNDSQKFGSDQTARVEEERVTTDAGNDESTNDPPEAAAASAVKGMRISDDRHTMEAEGNPPVAVLEGNDLKDSGVTVEPGKLLKKKKKSKKTHDPVTVTQVTTGMEVPPVANQEGNYLSKDIGIEHGSVMVNDSQKFGSDQTARVEEERVTTDAGDDERTNDPPEAVAASTVEGMRISDDCYTTEAEGNPPVAVQEGNDLKDLGVTVEPGKSSKKRKKSKKTQDPVTVTQVTSGTEVPPVAVQEGNDLSKDIGIEHGSVMVNDSQKFGSDQTARLEEERVLSQHNDSKTMPSTMCSPFSRDEIDMNSKVVVTSDLLDTNDNVEHGKSSKKRKKSAKCTPFSGEEIDMNSITDVTSNLLETNDIAVPGKSSRKKKKSKRTLDPLTSATEHMTCSVIGISSTEQHETVHNDHLSDKARKEEGILFPSEENEASKAKTVNAPILATDRETDNVIRNVLESLQDQDLSKTAENKVEKFGKKTKSIPELQTEDENVSCKNVNLAIDGTRELEVDASSILTKKNLGKISTEHQLNGSNCNPAKIAGVDTDPLHSQLNVKSSQVLSYKPDSNNGESPLQGKNSKLSEVSGTGSKAPPLSNKSDKFNSKTKEATSPNTVIMIPRSNKKKETIAASNSSLESFKSTIPQSERVDRHQSQVAVGKKISNNDIGEVLNISERKKSLLDTSGTIFKFDSDQSSDDEDGVDNSDTSTRTPSDNFLSSDYSDGDSSAPRNGSHRVNKEQRDRNISNSQYSLKLDTILRRSKSYKAAKLASQSETLDLESLADELCSRQPATSVVARLCFCGFLFDPSS